MPAPDGSDVVRSPGPRGRGFSRRSRDACRTGGVDRKVILDAVGDAAP